MSISQEHIIELIQEYQQGRISEEGIQKLQKWLKEDEVNSEDFAKYLALFKESGALSNLDQIQKEDAWLNISKSLSKPEKKTKVRRLYTWLPYAAAVVVLFAVSYFMIEQVRTDYDFGKDYNFAEISSIGSKKAVLTLENGQKVNLEENDKELITEADGTLIQKNADSELIYDNASSAKDRVLYNQIEIPRGGEYSLVLADGTKVWLNSESSLRYPVQFVGNKRKVELTGEAYFEVSHNPDMPFIIASHDTEIKVLGTSFNVSAYDDEEHISTTLVEGSVELSCLGNMELLKPGFQATVKKGDNRFKVERVNTVLYTSWKDGVFRYKDQSLEEICHQLSRWYNVEFFFTDHKYREYRFTGAAKKNKQLDFTLNLIEKMADVQFAIKDDKIIVGKPE
ncbi:FecR family protein [Marinifilum sp. D737]|uniref:FecR family protein n=1 Tax=Marinifilum sp. D737 TaxID=2969628 RepID=UPI0022726D46|nr:FecR family protein [Marinifilum sp. D737]MCY1636546.1 FecR domain-containing protein [Marinifilum sp. D737]